MLERICLVVGCGRKVNAKGLCSRHYYRNKRGGDITTKSAKEKTAKERFFEKVQINGLDDCWIWIGHKDQKGYGTFRPQGGKAMVRAHRYSYEIFKGPIPSKLICHICDNPSCVNPSHLFAGSDSDNMQDMVDKGRHGRGGVKKRLLTEEQAISVFMQRNKTPIKVLMRQYGVSKPTISSIWNRRNYSEVTKNLT